MMSRCYNGKEKSYARYGGVGITVSRSWHKFKNFYLDMGDRPEGTTLDRKDNAKGYSKENCRWATYQEQAINRSVTRAVEYRGRLLLLPELAELSLVSLSTLYQRLFIYGWGVEKAVSTPSKQLRTCNRLQRGIHG